MKNKRVLISLLFPLSFVTKAQQFPSGSYESYSQLNVGVSFAEGIKNSPEEFYPLLGIDYQLYDKKTKAGINIIGDKIIHGYLTYDLFSYGSFGTKFKSSFEYPFNKSQTDTLLTPSFGLIAFYNINNKVKVNIGYDYGVGGERIASAYLTYRFGVDNYYSFSTSNITKEKIYYVNKSPVEKLVVKDNFTKFFAFDSYVLTNAGKTAISDFSKRIDLNRVKMIYISGHTDKQGSAKYNWDLSRKRARSVYDKLLVETGIEQDKVNYYGLGETSPISDDPNENRRVEILVQYENSY